MRDVDLQPYVGTTYAGLADLLERAPASTWDAPSLCAGWRVREVVAHVTMPVRFTPEEFGAAMAEHHGDFGALSNAVAERDAGRPVADQLADLRSPVLAGWQPPGGGAVGALNHAVVHSLDVTVALAAPDVAPEDARRAILADLVGGGAARFDVDTTDRRFLATDIEWAWGEGRSVSAGSGELVALLCHRTLPDGRSLAG